MENTECSADLTEVRIWLFEDSEVKIQRFIEDIGRESRSRCKCVETLREARQAIDDISDGDVVSVDSYIDADTNAGSRIVAEIRRRGKLCHLLWHGGLPPPVGMKDSLVFEWVSGIDAAARRAAELSRTRTFPHLDRKTSMRRGREWLAGIECSPFISYLPLYICCMGYLCIAGALHRGSLDAEARNPVMDQLGLLPERVKTNLFDQAQRFAEQARHLVQSQRGSGWFDAALETLEADWEELRRGSLGTALMKIVGRQGWRKCLNRALELELAAEMRFLKRGSSTGEDADQPGEKRFTKAIGDTSGLCRHLLALRESRVGLKEGFTEEWCKRVGDAYLGLRFLARVFLNYSTDPLMKERRNLNHAVSNNEIGFLFFQADRRAETEKVLKGTAGENSGGDTKRRLRKWPVVFNAIRENTERITCEFDPLSPALESLEGSFSKELVEWLTELTQENSRLWLGLMEWKVAVEESMEAFDLALPKEFRARVRVKDLDEEPESSDVDIDKLAELFQNFRGEYRGERFFNIGGRA